jgi:hypothetical protein
MTAGRSVPRGARVLLAGAVDYAGTFPPAALDVRTAVQNYARYRAEGSAWMLGRLVLAADALDEFELAAAGLLPGGPQAVPWPISVVGGWDLLGDVKRVEAFNARHGRTSVRGRAVVEFIEHRVGKPADVRRIDEQVPVPVRSAYEVPLGPALGGILRFVKQVDGVAKIRTGGATADAIPPVGVVAEFIVACAREKVPVKATAGLHHAVRGDHPIHCEVPGVTAVQHGFLNVLVASAVAYARNGSGATQKDLLMLVETILDERDPSSFVFDEAGVTWWDYTVPYAELERARAEFFEGFGSCSFEEPVTELHDIGMPV